MNEELKENKEVVAKKPIYQKWWFWFGAVLVFLWCVGIITGTNTPTEDEHPPEQTTLDKVTIGSDKEHPYVLTATELAEEINADINAAKAKYNGKWVKITGKISDTSNGGIMYGYYVYGKSSLTGYTGLRIICWCDDGPYSGSVLGDTKTFLGQLREVTTFNAIEIGDCEIVK